MFDMKNQNSLISFAYIKVSDNPLSVFCHYILYILIKTPKRELRADELKEKLFEEFGISMPPQLINNCIKILEKKGEVERLSHGSGYRIIDTRFDVNAFEDTRMRLHEHEEKLLQSLIDFVHERYKKTWTKDEARTYLSHFMDKEGYGAQLFLQKTLSIEGGKVSPSLYIGRYIDHIQSQSVSLEKEYLEEVVNGMMVLQGIRQTEDYQQNKDQKFKGTVFFLDTKLVLRVLGFSWKAQVDSARDMVRLLREKYGAKIGIFPQTLQEVESALSFAGAAIQKGKVIRDLELKLYSELYPEEASMMLDYASNVRGLLKRYLGVDEPTDTDWNADNVRKHNIAVETIADYIEDKCGWKRGSINYDVQIINQINILRKSDYSVQYGGRNKLPVFVTSNTKLAYTFRDYINENEENGRGWNPHALPVISDNMLLYRIWLPFATEFSNLPALTLSRFAYAAQSEGVVFFEKFRKMAATLDQIKDVDLVSTTEAARRKLEDILIRETDGALELMTNEIAAYSFEECVRMDHLVLVEENENLSRSKTTRDSQVIELLAQKYIDKLGWDRVWLCAAKVWWVIAFAVLFAVTSKLGDSVWLKGLSVAPIVIEWGSFLVDKFVDDHDLRFSLYRRVLLAVKERYILKIRNSLENTEYEPDTNAVVDYCIAHTKVFVEEK